eukprot:Protomagalhaensia_sp_Gyna_25__2503@NODE_2406_length_1104_cov_5_034742_g1995_i0_p3_GENE_NODE_2406_length_1104_cov_5_034742_g1995_i0NODE_2406_length_1104_cov_5_034742_g1995_i0_p3_ORF_typecomplete_len127_score21_86FtsA/PF14450_6/0_06_NODE_2406_length_1104_cov_5_034742_g1995_i0221601
MCSMKDHDDKTAVRHVYGTRKEKGGNTPQGDTTLQGKTTPIHSVKVGETTNPRTRGEETTTQLLARHPVEAIPLTGGGGNLQGLTKRKGTTLLQGDDASPLLLDVLLLLREVDHLLEELLPVTAAE